MAETIAAWWGAIVATGVLVYTIYTRRQDESIKLTVKSWRQSISILEVSIFNTHVTVSNVGKRSTTIEEVTIEDDSAPPASRVWANVINHDQPLPHSLEPGASWSGVCDTDLAEMISGSLNNKVMICIRYAHSDLPIRLQFRPKL